MGHQGGPAVRGARAQLQVQDPGRLRGGGAHPQRGRTGHPHSKEGRLLGLPHGHPQAHGAVHVRGGSGED